MTEIGFELGKTSNRAYVVVYRAEAARYRPKEMACLTSISVSM
jgi:hypothetical protein